MNDTVDKNTLIYTLVASIPVGQVASYGQIARLAGYPNHARLVGHLLKAMPADSNIPWHRVVNSQGKISFAQGSEQYQTQYQKLQAEGVVFKNSRINLRQFGWL